MFSFWSFRIAAQRSMRAAMGTQEWSKRLITRSGCLFDVRPAHVGDEAVISELFDHHPSKTFLACVDDGAVVIAAVVLDCDTDPKHGKVNLVTRPDFKHDGVSWELLEHMLHYATAIGVLSLESVETRENHAAIAIETEIGFTAHDHPGNPALVLMRKSLGTT